MPNDLNRRRFLGTSTLLGTGLLTTALRGAETPLAPPDKQPPELALPAAPPARRPGFAIVGLGKLALEEVMPAFAACGYARPTALVSGHADKAKRVAAAYGVDPKAIYNYDNFDQIADNKEIDAVYIILPNSMHCEFTLRALKAGKHVLCEKPLSVTSEESQRMVAAARDAGKQLMTAYRLHYEPFNLKVMEACSKKAFGAIRTISTANCQVVQAPNIRLSKELGGGPVGDVGVYCINAARYITGEQPVEVTAMARQPKDDPRFREVPASVAFTLRFPSGAVANCDCGFDAAESRFFKIHCEKGTIEMDPAFSYRGLKMCVTEEGFKREVKLREVDHFAAEMDHFAQCLLSNKPNRTPGEMGLADMLVIEAIDEAVRTGKAVKVAAAKATSAR